MVPVIKSPAISDYCINARKLECVQLHKDLGLTIRSRLSWNTHLDVITGKANKVLGLVKRTSRVSKDIGTLRTFYCGLVRPLLE